MEINYSTLITNWINFAIIIVVLKHFFWDKLKGIIAERQKYVDDKLTKADEDSEKAIKMSAWMDNYMDALKEMDED